ncbi:MAG TPA: acetylglutamate kinase [Actinomycetota bacterium]
MREHGGAVIVVKLGGSAMSDPGLLETFALDVALLRQVGVRPVIVHGGGPQITRASERLGLTPRFIRGLRVTDAETLEVVRTVLVGRINKDLVKAMNERGAPAAGVSGEDADLMIATRRSEDLGLVGSITEVRPALLGSLMEDFVPVVASLATDGAGQSLNVNADEAAAALAVALGASKLVYLTDVPGIIEDRDGDAALVSEASVAECERLLSSGAVTDGMIPKLEHLIHALRGGVQRGHVLDGRVPHAMILELFTPEGLGTMVTREEA